jgi:hypothetical protein
VLAIRFVLIGVEFLHGLLRATFPAPVVGEFRTRQIGVSIGSALIILFACVFIRRLHGPNAKALVLFGGLWTVLTFASELAFGNFVFGRSGRNLALDYDVHSAGLLGFRMILRLFLPAIPTRVRGAVVDQRPGLYVVMGVIAVHLSSNWPKLARGSLDNSCNLVHSRPN